MVDHDFYEGAFQNNPSDVWESHFEEVDYCDPLEQVNKNKHAFINIKPSSIINQKGDLVQKYLLYFNSFYIELALFPENKQIQVVWECTNYDEKTLELLEGLAFEQIPHIMNLERDERKYCPTQTVIVRSQTDINTIRVEDTVGFRQEYRDYLATMELGVITKAMFWSCPYNDQDYVFLYYEALDDGRKVMGFGMSSSLGNKISPELLALTLNNHAQPSSRYYEEAPGALANTVSMLIEGEMKYP